MASFKNEKGLTLIELLITISVLAVVSAIALPVINNVVTSSNSNALTQSQSDVTDFINRYSKGGVVLVDGNTLSGYVDSDGDNKIEAGEQIDSLTLDSKYTLTATGSASIGGSYTAGGVTGGTVAVAGGTSAQQPSGVTFSVANGDFGATSVFTYAYWSSGSGSLNLSSYPAILDLLDNRATWTVTWTDGTDSTTYTTGLATWNPNYLNGDPYPMPAGYSATLDGVTNGSSSPYHYVSSIVIDEAAGTITITIAE